MSPRFHNEDERAAWELAEFMIQQARSMMREAEKSLESWKLGKEMNRQRCARRGINQTDAEIRWAASSSAKNAITNNNFHVSLATMYYGAATANYARAEYFRNQR
ncbi:hypothetical protein FB565_005291 [Actinoplanes lutulentus]|uniref:Uncharacterized protein n=1 Tax=Actinoplanes lutulentus TaxID=1287878 RepID=A0A327ZG25_9ACTN|nr:hypothetical protein [Actinoplanes lutulentus]MBB2945558.1 hypothetical protein [Actinoplanes lutulentus]RAK40310.1 hypothetical protein B0I29_103342 [Actinoplanes lutulentus]